MPEKNTTVRIFADDLDRIEAIKRRLTKIDGKPKTTAEVVRRMIAYFWHDGEDDQTLRDILSEKGDKNVRAEE